MSFVRVPPDSTGKRVYTKNQTVDGLPVEAQAVHLADATSPEQLLAIDRRGSASVRFAEGQPIMSGFGAVKTAEQRALGVYESSQGSYDDLFTIWEETSGSVVYDPEASSERLVVTGAAGSRALMITNRYHYYLPGTSNIVIMTVSCGDTGKAGNVRRWGAFDQDDGLYFELNGTVLNAAIRSSTTGTVVEVAIPRSSWNRDRLDGTGPSGHLLDVTKINIWWIDYQWLGAGRVRFGIYEPNGARLVCHELYNAGANVLPYMRTGTLPLATENVNISATGSSSELRRVCMAMYAEGTFEDYTFWRHSDMTSEGKTAGVTDEPLLLLRSKATIGTKRNSIIAYPETLNVYTDQPVAITMWQSVLPSGETWNISGQSSLEGSSSPGTLSYTEALQFKTFFFGPGAHIVDLTNLFELNDEGVQLTSGNTPEIWAFTGKRLGTTNATVTINVGYRELW